MPKPEVTTSRLERPNLTIRNFLRRFNRKTLCCSKKLENLRVGLALHFFCYSFGRFVGCTLAMEARLTDSDWSDSELMPIW